MYVQMIEFDRRGLTREEYESFCQDAVPAIAQIQQHCEVLRLDSPRDYRLRALTRSPVSGRRWIPAPTRGCVSAGTS